MTDTIRILTKDDLPGLAILATLQSQLLRTQINIMQLAHAAGLCHYRWLDEPLSPRVRLLFLN